MYKKLLLTLSFSSILTSSAYGADHDFSFATFKTDLKKDVVTFFKQMLPVLVLSYIGYQMATHVSNASAQRISHGSLVSSARIAAKQRIASDEVLDLVSPDTGYGVGPFYPHLLK